MYLGGHKLTVDSSGDINYYVNNGSTPAPLTKNGGTEASGESNFQIGTVTSGSTAQVSLSSSLGVNTLNFSLPKGDVYPQARKVLQGILKLLIFKVLVANSVPLPATGNTAGDGYITQNDGHIHVWDGSSWIDCGQIKGDKGDTGDTGAVPLFVVDVGVPQAGDGSEGDLYIDTNTGDIYGPKTSSGWPASSTNIRGAQGIAGLNGADGQTGAKGDKGDQGDAATISVGSVVTAATGQQVQVSNSGDTSNAVFDFTIPKGDKGDQGHANAVQITGSAKRFLSFANYRQYRWRWIYHRG